MRMVIDKYTGEPYDADEWYRGANGCWVNKKAEAEWNAKMAEKEHQRRERVNASRVARGKRRRSNSSFAKASSRYARWLELDTDIPFGDWIRKGYYKEAF